jgi:hypothetical protein
MGQAMAKHHLQHEGSGKGKSSGENHGREGDEQSNLGGKNHQKVLGHLRKAAEHLQHATEMHTKGTLSETQQEDPRHVDEEEEAPSAGEPGGSGLRGTGYGGGY